VQTITLNFSPKAPEKPVIEKPDPLIVPDEKEVEPAAIPLAIGSPTESHGL